MLWTTTVSSLTGIRQKLIQFWTPGIRTRGFIDKGSRDMNPFQLSVGVLLKTTPTNETDTLTVHMFLRPKLSGITL